MADRRLNGLNPLSYMGVNPYTPPDFVIHPFDPTSTDWQNFELGTFWLNSSTEDLWVLVSLSGNIAKWVILSGNTGSVTDLEGNSGGVVSPTGGVIHVVGDSTTIDIVGNPGTSTLTVAAVGTGLVQSLTGNSGGAVFPTAGNTNLVGNATTINIVGNPGTSTLTVSTTGSVADSFPTDAGTAVPSAGALTVHGSHGINTAGSASTVTVAINNAITLGDLTPLAANAGALTATTGDVIITAGDLTLPNTNAGATEGIIKFGGANFIHNYGNGNTFVGAAAGNQTLTVGVANTNVGIGSFALESLTTGTGNVGIAYNGLSDCTTGSNNVGISGGEGITTGSGNVAVGFQALDAVGMTGLQNVCIGLSAGASLTTSASYNVNINATGTGTESNVIRIADNTGGAAAATKCFIGGIRGVTTGNADAVAVLVDSAGQLGTVSSSLRFKENINDMGSQSDAVMALRPVTFNYKNSSSKATSYGLIAEEVADLFPDLVANDDSGIPYSVKYHELPSLLLNELQKQNKRIQELESSLKDLSGRMSLLELH